MVISGYALLFLGLLAWIVGEVMFLTVAYRRNLWWFFGCLLLPPIAILFVLLNLKTTLKPFAVLSAGLFGALFGAWMAGIEL
jgi:hypothetical protein